MHEGIDFPAPIGTPVLAGLSGQVIEAKRVGVLGNVVRIEHGSGLITTYAHLHRFAEGLKPGDCVHKGQRIGLVGTTGLSDAPHLHFALLRDGKPVDPEGLLAPMMRGQQTDPAQ